LGNEENTKMTPLHILTKSKTASILDKLNDQFGITKIPGQLIMRGEERVFIFTGDLTEQQLKNLENIIFIERAGIYFATIEPYGGIRLSLEGSQMVSDQITKNIFEIPDKETLEQWMSGQELPIQTGKKDFLIMKYQDDFLGTGKASENKISNFIPKNRRLKLRTTIK
jgi:NOL1/NOP2/fmu family ribosome biogenesis protein